MAHTLTSDMRLTNTAAVVHEDIGSPAFQAFQILRIGFTVAPILAGLDKFAGIMTNWDKYLAPSMKSMLGSNSHTFMLAVGIIEVVAGIGVFFKPRFFAYVVAVWLMAIIVNLLMI